MSTVLVAAFADAQSLRAAAGRTQAAGDRLVDTFTPFPVEGIGDLLGAGPNHVRMAMLVGGVATAALAYGVEWYSAVIDYPINSGGRPLHSWPAFMLFPFAVGILAAAICGFIALLVQTGLPRLHHPLFEIAGFEQASQGWFLLAIETAADAGTASAARQRLLDGGAVAIHEVAT
jgi:hypothetical protein